ncbi:MAG: 16S rRNA (cytosine(1402)-N(4))-methyltransferase RsmH [Deltaproteobacteria bacterium]|nr:16S rRNA (cytosine(1402)-N(4))-methyltransferase RsmH [Deltaproteobacteria bacterium]
MHVPVLLQEMLQAIRPRSGGIYLDGTLGSGGYAEAILEASRPDGIVIGLDLDREAIVRASDRLCRYGERFRAVHGGFQHAGPLVASLGIRALDGAVLDLGLSSDQLEDPERGFSFRVSGPLDMRFDTSSGPNAMDYLNTLSVRQLEEMLATYGGERYCKKLSRGIIQARDVGRLRSTGDLANTITRLIGQRRGKIHPATRTFRALRIAVNQELDNLSAALEQIPPLLVPGGCFCVVSYHSLEDRLVKTSFRSRKREPDKWIVVTERPVRPSVEEVKANPRSRSARMRVLEAVSAGDFDKSLDG